MKGENCIRQRVEIDGDHVYVIVGADFTHVKGRFENRTDEAPISRAGAENINKAIHAIWWQHFEGSGAIVTK